MIIEPTSSVFILRRDRERGWLAALVWHPRLECWLAAGGHVESNETAAHCGVRETLEETGLDVTLVPGPDAPVPAGFPHQVLPAPWLVAEVPVLLTELTKDVFAAQRSIIESLLVSPLVIDQADVSRDLAALVVPDAGRLMETGDPWEPYRLLDANGAVVEPVAAYLAELQARDRSASTLRSYGNDLLLWWRWLGAVEVAWDKATRAEARDFARWMQVADKSARVHWRYRDGKNALPPVGQRILSPEAVAASVNPVTGKARPGAKYSARTRGHVETVLRSFYEFHLECGRGPIINPFPLDRSRRAGRANAHHNPMEPFRAETTGRYRPTIPRRAPRRIPDEQFNELFGGLKYNRDRALLAFWVSSGARAEELLGACQGDADPGEQLITVTRKGTRAVQQIPASPDAFVWLRLYQEEAWRTDAPRGRAEPLWFTLRRPWRPLSYHAARAMFMRANALLGSDWTLHDLRHTAAWRMAQDPEMPITDVQWILAHAHLSTTQLYTAPGQDEVIARALAHHERRRRGPEPRTVPPAPGYNPASLDILFGRRP